MRAIGLLMTAVFVLSSFELSKASTIIYSESITTDGSLGGTAFTNELVTLTFTADTANVTSFTGLNFTQFTNIPTASTLSVAGLGTVTFSDPISISLFDYSNFSEFEVSDTATSTDVLDTFGTASAFSGYGLNGPVGPVSGGAAYSVGALSGTSAGNFAFTRNGGGVSSVSAVISAVPEPSILALLAAGLLSLISYLPAPRATLIVAMHRMRHPVFLRNLGADAVTLHSERNASASFFAQSIWAERNAGIRFTTAGLVERGTDPCKMPFAAKLAPAPTAVTRLKFAVPPF